MTSHFCNLFCKRCGANLYATASILPIARTMTAKIHNKNPTFGSPLFVTLECSECLLYMGGRRAFNELQAAFLNSDDHRMLGELDAMSQPDVPTRRSQ